MKRATILIAMLAVGLPALAATVVVDGTNDFPPAALIDADGGDTEFAELDLGDVYVTNDGTNLYIGYGHDHGGWGTVQVGIAIGTIDGQGGDNDPWDRRIDFVGQCLPDFIAYKNIDSDYDDLVTWVPGTGWTYGVYDINWVTSTTFDELEIPLAQIAAECPDFHQVFLELWVTQDNCNKGPLDLSYDDAQQLSTTGGTTWELNCDGSEDIALSCYHCYVVDCGSTATETSTWGKIKNLWH